MPIDNSFDSGISSTRDQPRLDQKIVHTPNYQQPTNDHHTIHNLNTTCIRSPNNLLIEDEIANNSSDEFYKIKINSIEAESNNNNTNNSVQINQYKEVEHLSDLYTTQPTFSNNNLNIHSQNSSRSIENNYNICLSTTTYDTSQPLNSVNHTVVESNNNQNQISKKNPIMNNLTNTNIANNQTSLANSLESQIHASMQVKNENTPSNLPVLLQNKRQQELSYRFNQLANMEQNQTQQSLISSAANDTNKFTDPSFLANAWGSTVNLEQTTQSLLQNYQNETSNLQVTQDILSQAQAKVSQAVQRELEQQQQQQQNQISHNATSNNNTPTIVTEIESQSIPKPITHIHHHVLHNFENSEVSKEAVPSNLENLEKLEFNRQEENYKKQEQLMNSLYGSMNSASMPLYGEVENGGKFRDFLKFF